MRVLSIDGGGIRGLIPALVLAEIERRTGRPISASFDLIAGTSTGGILACALTRPAQGGAPFFTAAGIAELYGSEGPRIFHRTLERRVVTVDGNIAPKYDDAGLNAALRTFLGDARISQALTGVLITAYDLERREARFFRSTRARASASDDYRMADAARATSAAPTYFAPALVRDVAGARQSALVDGGVFAVNPALCAAAEVGLGEVDLLVSLGTGSHTRPIRYADAKGWGRLNWAEPIIDVVFDGVADTTEFEIGRFLAPTKYVRLQTELTVASDALDDASAKNLRDLRTEAEKLLRDHAADVDRVVAALS